MLLTEDTAFIVTSEQNSPRLDAALSDDLRRAPWKGDKNPLAGHCYVAAEAQYHRAKSLGYPVKSMFIRHEGRPHWFVVVWLTESPWVFDPTSAQFQTPVPYSQAKGKGFLTKEPSKRARVLMERMGW